MNMRKFLKRIISYLILVSVFLCGTGICAITAYAAPASLPGGSRIGEKTVSRAESGEPRCVLINTSKISLSLRFDSLPDSDNGIIFVYELRPYEYSIPEGASPVAATILSLNPTVTVSYTDNRLFSKFVFATRQNGSMTTLCTPQYISNPELETSKLACNALVKALTIVNRILPSTPDDFPLLVFAADRELLRDSNNAFFEEL